MTSMLIDGRPAQIGKGRVICAWFGVVESPEDDGLLFDLSGLAAGKIAPAPPAN